MKKLISLADLEVLVLDCQATGANPESSHLVEIGWTRTRASQAGEFNDSMVESYLPKLPKGAEIPRRVSRITGLKTGDMARGLPIKKIWEKLVKSARKIASAGGWEQCPTIIHFSSFETPYLRFLHGEFTKRKPFPFEVICTHRLTRRLLPDLPRKGLRAAAGYLGHSVPELRRAGHHVAATVFIWQRVVELLEKQGVRTLEELRDWLSTPLAKPAASAGDFPMEPALRRALPKQPGIYRMLRSNGDLLYIGKATSLKHRVNSYFHKKKRGSQAGNTLEMLTQASHLEVMVTGSALEAALLETDEIKKHSPPYNIALRQRDREIAFFSRDLRQYSPAADDLYPIGPLPSGQSLAAFAAIGALLKEELTGRDSDIPAITLGIPMEYAPETGCFREGFDIFRDRHDALLKKNQGNYFLKDLLLLGKRLRLQKLEESAAAEPAEENGETGTEEKTATWTPEAVADVMEGVVRHGAHLIRRARWFCLLSQCSLAWQTGETAGRRQRLLILQNGTISHREDITEEQSIPSPPGFREPFAARKRHFDVMTYDRLRVLTTELRRIVSDETDRHVRLRLSPRAALGRRQLLDLLKLV